MVTYNFGGVCIANYLDFCHFTQLTDLILNFFRLFPFPTQKKDREKRERWKQLVGRAGQGKKLWSPSKDSRICSNHFIDGQPTVDNPYPTLNLGYDGYKDRVRRITLFGTNKAHELQCYKTKIVKQSQHGFGPDTCVEDPPLGNLPRMKGIFEFVWPWIVWVINLIIQLVDAKRKTTALQNENEELRATIKKLKTEKLKVSMDSDEDVNFHTGLKNRSLFNKLHDVVAPLVKRRWTGVLSMTRGLRNLKKKPSTFGPSRKLPSKSEFLLMLMKLRLGLLNKDLAKRFQISCTLCSRIFFSWLRAASQALRHLVFIPDQEAILASKPDRYRSLPDLHSIIDCTEIFIETPKDLHLQGATWSDYKHHNTVKILIACTANSFICFVSPAYTGRISDKALTIDCGFLDRVPPYSMIMADKGFNIASECAVRHLSLHVPPGKRGQSQMSTDAVKKTKRIANYRILIEQVIRRVKTFRILVNEIPISLISHMDDIVTVCCALSNLKNPIYKT